MKKFISLFLALLMLTAVPVVPAQAAYEQNRTVDHPVICICGNATTIYDEDGVAVYDFDPSADQIKACAKRVLPLLLKGFVTNNFDEYYRAFGEEMTKIYYHCQLDGNGDPQWGTGISPEEKQNIQDRMQANHADENGKFDIGGIAYPVDWRLDPLQTAEGLNDFINAILAKSGKDKVNLSCNCLGGEMLLAYTAKYGTSKLNALQFTETVAFGSELVDDTFAGRISFDSDAAVRFMGDDFIKDEMRDKETLRVFLEESIILAKETGIFDGMTNLFMRKLFNRLYEGLMPELCLATFGTWPGYWTLVTKDHYADTRDFIFGKPGSERYEKYAGLIKKLDNWDVKVRQRIPELLQGAIDKGTKLGISVRYGFQFPPILQSNNVNGDVWVSVKNASLGATVSDIGTTLSDNYIARCTEEGFGKYISPDKQIDASTCAFPDYTWFVKDAVHNTKGINTDAFWRQFYNYKGIPTVDTLEGRSQFMVVDWANAGNPGGAPIVPMTEENMNTESFEVNPKEKTFFEKVKYFFEHVILWYKALFALIKEK